MASVYLNSGKMEMIFLSPDNEKYTEKIGDFTSEALDSQTILTKTSLATDLNNLRKNIKDNLTRSTQVSTNVTYVMEVAD